LPIPPAGIFSYIVIKLLYCIFTIDGTNLPQ
jgi:hypothetical protein